ncbi:MAG: PAS domain-containing sensor histidine kinase [Candidatus Heimdallarchaeaceae archaeon]
MQFEKNNCILSKNDSMVSNICDIIGAIIIVLDKQGKIVQFNKASEKLTGYKKEELKSKVIWNFLIPKDEVDSVKSIFNSIMKGNYPNRCIHNWATKEGKLKLISWSNTAITNKDGEVEYIIATGIDITEKINSDIKVKNMLQKLSIINSILCHDLNNNLSAILGYIEAFLDLKEDYLLERAKKTILNSFNLIQKMKELEKATLIDKKLQRFNIKIFLDGVKEICSNHGVNCNIEGKGEILADEALKSVFGNLVSNAIKHGKADKINIKVEEEKSVFIIYFIDNGAGIPDVHKSKLFDIGFKYGDKAGMGLGLFIVRSTIERYGGEIRVEDNKPKGTKFIFSIPKYVETEI